LAEAPDVNPYTWASVRARVSFRFERSQGYLLVLAIVACLSAIGLVHGLEMLSRADTLDSLSSLFALGACFSIVASWIWMLAASRGTNAYGRIEDSRLMLAFLGFIAAPFYVILEKEKDDGLQRWFSLVTVAFLPGVFWLSIGGVSQFVPMLLAILIVALCLLVAIAVVVVGFSREWAMKTPLLGLFLTDSDSSGNVVDVDPDLWSADYRIAS
jgi:uncharacterized membrane protein YhaH (DUF805 family)